MVKQLILDQLHDAENEVARIRDEIAQLRAQHVVMIDGVPRLINIEPRFFYERERLALNALDTATRKFFSRLEELANA